MKRKQTGKDDVLTIRDRVVEGQTTLELCAHERADLVNHIVIETIGDGLCFCVLYYNNYE